MLIDDDDDDFKSIIPVGKPICCIHTYSTQTPVLLSCPAYIVREQTGEFCVAAAPARLRPGLLVY